MPGTISEHEFALMRQVFSRHPQIAAVKLFGSRAKGTNRPASDVDLALYGDLAPLEAERVGGELDELPLPYVFDVKAMNEVKHMPLREHIERVGVTVYQGQP